MFICIYVYIYIYIDIGMKIKNYKHIDTEDPLLSISFEKFETPEFSTCSYIQIFTVNLIEIFRNWSIT